VRAGFAEFLQIQLQRAHGWQRAVVCVAVLSIAANVQASKVAYWSFDTNYENAFGNAIYDGAAIGTGVSISTMGGEFKVGGGALRIDSSTTSTGYIDITSDVLIGTSGSMRQSVVGWYKYSDIAADGSDTRNFLWETAPSNYPLSFGIRSDTADARKHAQWFSQTPDVNGVAIDGPLVDDNEWHHVAVVIDEAVGGRYIRYYHDGVLRDDVPLPENYVMSVAPTGFHIGNHRAGDGARNWDGFIDEIAVFDQLLTAEQIAGLYNQTLAINDIPSIGTRPGITVNRTTGEIHLTNPTASPITINSYQITSLGNSLVATTWNSLDDQNVSAVDGTDNGSTAGDSQMEGWDEGQGSNAHRLIETNLLAGTEIPAGGSFNLGIAYNTTLNLADLDFRYGILGQGVELGAIDYITGQVMNGDFNHNNVIDAADYVVWRKTMGSAASYNLWRSTFGANVGSGAGLASSPGVPEPSLGVLLACMTMLGMAARRIRR
jgi:hypothetical protein